MDDARDASVDPARPVRVEGGFVRRPAGAWTPTVHAFLRHLRDQGLDCVPDPVGVDGDVETLTLIPGDSGDDGWAHQHSEAGLRSAARLLRRVHDASAGWVPPEDAVWGSPPVPVEPPAPSVPRVFCHGDAGPWNLVWRDGEAVGLIDWDYLHPGPALDDVAYSLRWFAPFRSDHLVQEWHRFPEVPDRRARVRAFLDAYGGLPGPPVDLAEAMAQRAEAAIAHTCALAEEGVEPHRTWVEEGSLDTMTAEVRWVRGHRHLLDED